MCEEGGEEDGKDGERDPIHCEVVWQRLLEP